MIASTPPGSTGAPAKSTPLMEKPMSLSTTIPMRDTARARAARRAAVLMTIAVIGLAGCSSSERAYGDDAVGRGDFSTASIGAPTRYAAPVDTGIAAWDGDISAPGMTGAHASLPLGSWARITNTSTAATANVRITRRLVPGGGRDMELSRDAAAAVGALQGGPTVVMIEPLAPNQTATLERTAVQSYVPPQAVAAPARATPVAVAPTAGVAYDPNVSTASIGPAAAPRATTTVAGYNRPRFLQLGSYRNASNAYRMKAQIEREGLAGGVYGLAQISTSTVNGVQYHRVRLGPITNGSDGQRALRDARALGHNDARLITP